MLKVWEEYGFGTFRQSYLKIVNPDEFHPLLEATYRPQQGTSLENTVVLFATGMGDLLIWEEGYLVLLDYRHGTTDTLASNLNLFFKNHADDFNPKERMHWSPYPEARVLLGEPTFDKCFGYTPLLSLGEVEQVDFLQKVKLKEHLFLMSELSGKIDR